MGLSLSRGDNRITSMYTEEEIEEGVREDPYTLGETLVPFSYVDSKPDVDLMKTNHRYATYLVEKEDKHLQVALWGRKFDAEGKALMIVHPTHVVAVAIEDIYYPDDQHVLLPPAGYSWVQEEDRIRISISAVMRDWAQRAV